MHRERLIDVLWPDLGLREATPRLHKAALDRATRIFTDLGQPLDAGRCLRFLDRLG